MSNQNRDNSKSPNRKAAEMGAAFGISAYLGDKAAEGLGEVIKEKIKTVAKAASDAADIIT